MMSLLRELRKKVVIGVVGGSDLVKISEQFSKAGFDGTYPVRMATKHAQCACYQVLTEFDYTFGENGLTAFKLGVPLPSQSFIKFVGEERYKVLANFILHYIADLEIPIKR